MKFYFYLLPAFFLVFIDTAVQAADAAPATFYLIRHAEKDLTSKKDPELTAEGMLRAKRWAEVFQQIALDRVYSTDTRRTRNTAKPVAEAKGLPVELYSWSDMDFAAFRQQHAGEKVLIVGHSNTSPAFTNGLVGLEIYPELDESIYGNLYIVDVIGAGRTAKLLTINP